MCPEIQPIKHFDKLDLGDHLCHRAVHIRGLSLPDDFLRVRLLIPEHQPPWIIVPRRVFIRLSGL